jgi:hypothetical protein
MPALRILELWFHIGSATSRSLWAILANAPRFSNLEELLLNGCNMDIQDMTKFVLNQIDTLTFLDLSKLCLHECTMSDISTFYAKLSEASRLEDFYQSDMALVNNHQTELIRIPRRLCLSGCHAGEFEDGWTAVSVYNHLIHWKGHEELKEVLSDLAVCLSWW